MNQYYSKRNNLLRTPPEIDLAQLRQYFFEIFIYYSDRGFFNLAFCGLEKETFSDIEQIKPPTMAPNPALFLLNHLNTNELWPIPERYQIYSEAEIFSLIEILFDHVCDPNDFENKHTKKTKEEFSMHFNNILKLYSKGFYLEPERGFIMETPNKSLKEQLSFNDDFLPDKVYSSFSEATKQFYKFNSTLENKKSAITAIAGILENVRDDLKEIFEDGKKKQRNFDSTIFAIVNGYDIRHNRADQKDNYSKEIWYDWMMQYYSATIITYYKLLNINDGNKS